MQETPHVWLYRRMLPGKEKEGTIDNLSETLTEQETRKCVTMKDILEVASSFTQMLLKKAPDVAGGNPVKTAFKLQGLSSRLKMFVAVLHTGA